jgi:hypothetical protein
MCGAFNQPHYRVRFSAIYCEEEADEFGLAMGVGLFVRMLQVGANRLI